MVLPFISNKLDYSHSISRIPISSLLLFDKYPSRHSMRISHMPNNHRSLWNEFIIYLTITIYIKRVEHSFRYDLRPL